MNYIEQVETWFDIELGRYLETEDAEAFWKAVKARILESYRNGQRVKRSARKVEPSPSEK